MRLVVVAATPDEVPDFRGLAHGSRWPAHDIDLLVTGAGMVATAARLSRALAVNRYDLALNLGVCGSFDPALPPATVVHVVSDRIAELGAEDHDAFLTIDELGLLRGDDVQLVNTTPPAVEALSRLPPVRGITVNTVHGRADSIAAIVERLHPQIETMEGAAFMYACRIAGVPFAQVRAVSNMVVPRDRGAWRMEQAIASLGVSAAQIVDEL
jgi:futalosine hydrolase